MNVQSKPSKLMKGATGDWEVVIGMEVHAQVTSHAKLFSGSSTAFGAAPNEHVSLVDAAMPGMLPVINEECVKQAIRTGLGLKAKINLKSVFDRKNYFYPDLPQGYQISQYKQPVVGEGAVVVDLPVGESVTIGIERLHLEQDAGKSIHDQHPTISFVDLNRSGVALMEIVSKPDIRSAEEAQGYVAKLRSILQSAAPLREERGAVVVGFPSANQFQKSQADREQNRQELAAALGGLKGPIMKVAQLLATIPEALPAEYAAELGQLQSHAPPFSRAFPHGDRNLHTRETIHLPGGD